MERTAVNPWKPGGQALLTHPLSAHALTVRSGYRSTGCAGCIGVRRPKWAVRTASRVATAAPLPLAAPVTTAVRSANSGMLFTSTRCAALV
jgi:hypothetical protein